MIYLRSNKMQVIINNQCFNVFAPGTKVKRITCYGEFKYSVSVQTVKTINVGIGSNERVEIWHYLSDEVAAVSADSVYTADNDEIEHVILYDEYQKEHKKLHDELAKLRKQYDEALTKLKGSDDNV